jgi:hypothetical protein
MVCGKEDDFRKGVKGHRCRKAVFEYDTKAVAVARVEGDRYSQVDTKWCTLRCFLRLDAGQESFCFKIHGLKSTANNNLLTYEFAKRNSSAVRSVFLKGRSPHRTIRPFLASKTRGVETHYHSAGGMDSSIISGA